MKPAFTVARKASHRGRAVTIIRVFSGISDHFPSRASSWVTAGMCSHMGFLFLADPKLFTYQHSFGAMERVMSQHQWGMVCLTIGVLRLAALAINGSFPTLRWSPHIRAATSLLTCFVWLQFTLSFMASPVESSGEAIYPYLLLLDIWNGFSAAKEAGATRSYARGDNVVGIAGRRATRG